MKSKDIFIGEVKRCTDLYFYKQYGNKHYVGDFRIGNSEIGTIHSYVDTVKKEALLLKVNEKEYVWLDLLTNKFEEILLNLGIAINIISTSPRVENQVFVDEKTLKPCFKDENINLSVKKVKSLVQNSK